MADSSIETSPATPGGKALDAESIGATPLYRERVQVTGAILAEIARVLAANPAIGDYGLVTRNIPAAPATSDLTGASINAAASGDNTLVAAVGGQTVRVFKIFLTAASAVNIQFKDGAGTDLTGLITLTAGGSVVLDFDTRPWFLTSAGNAFILELSSAVQVSGRIYYTQS